MFYFVGQFLIRKKVDNKQIFLIIFLQSLVNYYINSKIGVVTLLGLVIMVFTTGILFRIIFKEKLVNIYLLIILGIVILVLVEMLVIILIKLTTKADPKSFLTSNIYRIAGGSISKIILYILIRWLARKIRYKIINYFEKKQIYELMFVLMLNIIVVFLGIWIYKNTNIIKGNKEIYIVTLFIGIIIFTILILRITKQIIKYTHREVIWSLKEREYKRQEFYIKNMGDMFKTLKGQRHDFNNHVGCIYGLMRMDKFAEARVYIEKLTKEANEYNEIVNANNPILTSLLNIKITKAKKKGIEVETNVDMNKDISIEYIDLSIIMGNLLDNAIEAYEHIKEGNRYIEVDIYTKVNNLIIKVTNRKPSEIKLQEKINKEGFTTKEDIQNHGFGLKNIRQVVSKYKGIIKIEDEGDIFKVNIAIPIEK
ncbi:MAG: GHKL domain-containing protein [Clostridia bacterium]|nr:GHKL domain-containing protein [Clostridia bacterium]